MASGDERADRPPAGAGAGLRIGIVQAGWNPGIVDRLAAGARRALDDLGVAEVPTTVVPGCMEIPLAAKMLARSGRADAIVVLGAVIRGETTHYELVSNAATNGVMAVQMDTGVPVGFGVATVETQEQALARSDGPSGRNVGEDAAYAAVSMALLARRDGAG